MIKPKVTNEDKNKVKGALRQAFSRSDYRKQIIDNGIVQHSDPKRKRVKTWVLCEGCNKPEAKSNMVIDHISPVIGTSEDFYDFTLEKILMRIWCDLNNLQRLCPACHSNKTSGENKLRREYKKGKKKNE